MTDELPEALRARIAESNGHWLWRGAMHPKGYGLAARRSTVLYAHRATWEALKGPVPEGQKLYNDCGLGHCVNPAHWHLAANGDHWRGHGRQGGRTRGD